MRVLRHLRLCPRPVAKVGLTDSCGWEIRARRSLAPPFMVQMRGCKTVETFHEPPLSRPSATLSPPCGERAGRGVPIWFMVPMRAQKRKEAFHEPRIYWKPFLAAGTVA